MPWFAAHVVLQMETTPPLDQVRVWENVYLVEAADHPAARAAGIRCGEAAAIGEFTVDGRPGRWVVAGVRKTMECDDADERPSSGTEVTFNALRLQSPEDLQRFVEGKEVRLVQEE